MPGPDPTVIIDHFHTIAEILQVVAILSGVFVFVTGLFKLKHYGEMRTMMSAQLTLMTPLSYLLGGTALLLFPILMKTALLSFWASSTPIAYNPVNPSGLEGYINAVIVGVRLFGLFYFFKSITTLYKAFGQQSQPGMVGKALMHMVGAILTVHIMGTIQLLEYILDMHTLS